MERDHAQQIAELLNARNQLVIRYDAERVLHSANNYLYELNDAGEVVACVELKRVQWYQFEIDHLTVSKSVEGHGYARTLVERAEDRARAEGVRVLQCTIRANNRRSQKLFQKNGFDQVSTFYYPTSGNNVGVWQKILSKAKNDGDESD
jgi:N-acetylglutamate synthase-like GNAT family acetyltransferase